MTKEKVANIIWLSDISKTDIDVAGGKGANLAEMFNLKLPVPPAFIVSAKTYQHFIEETKLKERITKIISSVEFENTADLEEKAKEIQEMITEERMPADLGKEILEAYDSLNVTEDILKKAKQDITHILRASKDYAFVAVRSSATAEDLANASFAGQQETFLNIKGTDALLEAIKGCWASLFTARAIYYRHKKGFKQGETNIAVVVQKMINADKAGVIFTINPLTNKKEIVVEACFGLGEGVVSGAFAPDHYVLNKEKLIITEKQIKKQDLYFTRNSAGETVKIAVPPIKRGQQVLSDNEIKKLSIYAMQIEEHYKKPQDIEFAIELGELYILQTRPITTISQEIKKVGKIDETPILEGLPASPGMATGKVKIVHSLSDLSKIITGDILVTKMTDPDMVVTMQKCAAIITDEGGSTAHAAIVSREMGIPCIVGTMKATSVLEDNQIVTVSGTTGKVYNGKVEIKSLISISESEEEPHPVALAVQESEKEKELAPMQRVKTKIYMNLGEPEKIDQYKNLQFDGIGLMRLEFIIASQIREHPLFLIKEGEQQKYVIKLADNISLVARIISPKPIVVRFSDFKTNEYRGLKGGEEYEGEEANPMIGFRGVSRYISENFKEAFRLECRAIKKVLKQNDNVWVMLPFVRTTDEVKKCIEIMEEEGLRRSETFKIWIMAEVPSTALIPEEFAKLPIDGVSIGSNDLTQLVLGVDRDSALLGRMGYFDERNPAVLQAIHNIIQGFHKHGKTVSICGQAPSVYPEIVDFLINENVDSMSVNPDAVNSVRAEVKKREKLSESNISNFSDSGNDENENKSSRIEIKSFKSDEIDRLMEENLVQENEIESKSAEKPEISMKKESESDSESIESNEVRNFDDYESLNDLIDSVDSGYY